MKKLKIGIILVLLVIVITWLCYRFYQAYQPQPVRLQGQIQAQQYSISSKVPGRIDQVMVRKGDTVKKSQLIFTLFSPEIDAKLDQAIANQKAAGAMLEEAQKGARTQEIQASKNQWLKAKAAAELREKTYQRINNLYKDGVVAEQKSDEANTERLAAKYTEEAAYQMYQLTLEGASTQSKVAAQQKEVMAGGVVAEVQASAADTKITSWFNGEVSQVLLNSGELAPPGFPVVTIIDTKDAWAVLNVREDLLKHFEQGMRFSAYLPALDKSITFEVSHVAVMGDFATWRSTDAAKGFDLRTFEVEARPVESIDNLRMGMSVVVEL